MRVAFGNRTRRFRLITIIDLLRLLLISLLLVGGFVVYSCKLLLECYLVEFDDHLLVVWLLIGRRDAFLLLNRFYW